MQSAKTQNQHCSPFSFGINEIRNFEFDGKENSNIIERKEISARSANFFLISDCTMRNRWGILQIKNLC